MFQNRSFPTNFALFSNPADFKAFVFLLKYFIKYWKKYSFKQAEKRKTHVPKWINEYTYKYILLQLIAALVGKTWIQMWKNAMK